MSRLRELRANAFADMIIERKLTIRQVAAECEVSRSTVQFDLANFTTGKERKRKLAAQLQRNYKTGVKRGGLIAQERARFYRNNTVVNFVP